MRLLFARALSTLRSSRSGSVGLELAMVAPAIVMFMVCGIEVVSVILQRTRAQEAAQGFAQSFTMGSTGFWWEIASGCTAFATKLSTSMQGGEPFTVYQFYGSSNGFTSGNIYYICGAQYIDSYFYNPSEVSGYLSGVTALPGQTAYVVKTSYDYSSPFRFLFPSLYHIEAVGVAIDRATSHDWPDTMPYILWP